MPRPQSPVPAYTRHTASGQAVVRVRLPDGRPKDIYLGVHGSPESRAEYARVVALVAANNGTYPAAAPALTVNQLLLAYLKHALAYYREPDGTPARSVDTVKLALGPVKRLFGYAPAAEFGPKSLKAVREEMVAAGLARKTVNNRIGVVKQAFRWAASEELVPAAVAHGLATVAGLRAGRTDAPDNPPVRPADPADVGAALPSMPPPVAAAVRLQMHTGARCGSF